jgi:uncharacterized integral membrane protein
MRLLWWIMLAVVAVVLILFAVSNREMVSVGLWPLPDLLQLPLYLVLLGALFVGFIVGELVAWVGGWRWRREARRGRERIAMLEREIDAARTQRAASRAQVVAIPP